MFARKIIKLRFKLRKLVAKLKKFSRQVATDDHLTECAPRDNVLKCSTHKFRKLLSHITDTQIAMEYGVTNCLFNQNYSVLRNAIWVERNK